MKDKALFLDHIETPIGRIAVVADEAGRLCAAGWTEGHSRMARLCSDQRLSLLTASNPGGLTAAFRAYFAGELTALDGVPVAIEGGSAFQRAVWQTLRKIPCGETRSYAEVARMAGHPSAVRAVGMAAGANPVAVVLPCHRVIGSDGSLTGYGGGIERKRWLLSHERWTDLRPQLALRC